MRTQFVILKRTFDIRTYNLTVFQTKRHLLAEQITLVCETKRDF